MLSTLIEIDTSSRQVVDLTPSVQAFCADQADGLCNVFVPHATAGLAVLELGAGSDVDLLDAVNELLPRDERWNHHHGSPGHGADHVLPAFISPSMTVPVLGGQLQLGTWQSIALVDTNADNPRRQVQFSFVAA